MGVRLALVDGIAGRAEGVDELAQGGMRQVSESAVVGGQPLGYPSLFIEVY